ncbi:hypothetical protein QTP88_028167 [Uroleucon formosanum]
METSMPPASSTEDIGIETPLSVSSSPALVQRVEAGVRLMVTDPVTRDGRIDTYSYIKAFKLKLILFTNQLIEKNLAYFPKCNKFKLENDKEFPTDFAVEVLTYLNEQFQTQFRDFESAEDRIRIFENPFAIKIETLSTEFQLEVIELITNNNFKDYFKESSLQQF